MTLEDLQHVGGFNGYHPYHIQLQLELLEEDLENRRILFQWAPSRILKIGLENALFSDGATFRRKTIVE